MKLLHSVALFVNSLLTVSLSFAWIPPARQIATRPKSVGFPRRSFDGRKSSLSSTASSDTFQFQTGEPFPYALEVFQGAVTYNEMLSYLNNKLLEYGYSIPQTLCATSLCGDEMNRPLEQALSQTFCENYSLGGLAGCPFGGVTSFKKMKTHIPDGGNSVIVYGPHVGISQDGRIGHVDRAQISATEGEHTLCCRSAILAANHVSQVLRGEAEAMPMDLMDASQYFVGNMLRPYAERLEAHQDENSKMMDLPYVLFEGQTDLLYRIIQEGSQFGFPGAVAVLGGIQINTPPGYLDYYVPLRFELYNAEGQYLANMFESPS
ncbi:Inherit from NOG: Low-co2 inducible protein [Seminavis robusta]|uniref:Inherit from NOG: Low-co2 inducible protein n=1 Tax=Seminavis robusta TaxID=568900 RepID=A0A9N8DWN6_9STRA|nr:Inherit from NOG: Low-co2 inducible protein [Seminavis robusta]|eukprot:Sro337_g120470.1 Inherit from NOG: Low-co2 inducible protein (320) ;mRNA; f:265-1224